MFLQLGGQTAPPSGIRESGGTVLADGRVYSFCEMPSRGSVFAVVSTCDGQQLGRCRDDHIIEYDVADGTLRQVLTPFHDEFHGRMLHAVCLQDTLQVGMSFTRANGEEFTENVMQISVDGPPRVVERLGDFQAGHRLLHDPERHRMYYVSEYNSCVTFVDLETEPVQVESFSVGPPETPAIACLQTESDALSLGRDSLFFAEWVRGLRVWEVDRETHRTLKAYRVNNGGTHSLAVDDELGRLIITGLWGVEVIDLDTGRTIHRRRTDMGPRRPVIDRQHDLIYLTTTIGASLWVFDRPSLELLGQIQVGPGARNAFLTADASRLFASNGHEHFYWNADELAKRFGR